MIVQPDAVLTSPSNLTMVEAKRIRTAAFPPQQLAREYLALTRTAGDRSPLLLLVLGAAPPLLVTGAGRMSIEDSIRQHLPALHAVSGHPVPPADLTARISEVCAWITWGELADVVTARQAGFVADDPSVVGSVRRLAAAVGRAVARHA